MQEVIMFRQLWMRLLGHAVEEAIMFIQLWMRLLGHAVEEAIMFIQLWMRLLGHAVEEASMFIIEYGHQKLKNCCIVKKSLLTQEIAAHDTNIPRKVSKMCSLL